MIDFQDARTAMVDCQVRPSDVTKYTIIDAMLTVPREIFVPQQFRNVAYAGEHIPLTDGRVVLDPRVTGKMLDALALAPEDLVLNIGCGMGYMAALIGRMTEAVIALEADEDLAGQAAELLMQSEADNVVVEHGPLQEGAPQHGPYDVIVIEGAIEVLPAGLETQLKEGGRIAAIFSEGAIGQCRVGLLKNGAITWRRAFDATAPILVGFEREKSFDF